MALAQWHDEAGQFEEAETLLSDALDMRERLLGAEHHDVTMTRVALGNVLAEINRLDEACAMAAGAPEILSEALGDDHWRVAVARSLVGVCLAAEGDYPGAETQLLSSFARLDEESGSLEFFKKRTLVQLISLYQSWGRPDQAEKYGTILAAMDPSVGRSGL